MKENNMTPTQLIEKCEESIRFISDKHHHYNTGERLKLISNFSELLKNFEQAQKENEPYKKMTLKEIENKSYEIRPNSKKLDDNIARNNWYAGAVWMQDKINTHTAYDMPENLRKIIEQAIDFGTDLEAGNTVMDFRKYKTYADMFIDLNPIHTAQPAPVSVEEIVEAVMNVSGFKENDGEKIIWLTITELRTALQTLFNQK